MQSKVQYIQSTKTFLLFFFENPGVRFFKEVKIGNFDKSIFHTSFSYLKIIFILIYS
jgi:hypothetical protein